MKEFQQKGGSSVEPLKIETGLAGNPPLRTPLFSETISYKGRDYFLADPVACRALVALMDMEAALGGAASHYGGPAALAEIVSACFGYVFSQAFEQQTPWNERFHIINDAGHCENVIYALKATYQFAGLTLEHLKSFRAFNSKLTGHGEVHQFPEGVFLSNGPLGSSLAQAQGLALGDHLAGKGRTTIALMSDGACFEGEAREAFASIPGFAQRRLLAPLVCIVSDNNTKLSGRIDEQSFSLQPTFEAMEALGWRRILLADGNSLRLAFETIVEGIRLAEEDPTRPVFIQAKTIKGIGTAKTVQSASGGHGFPISDPKQILDFVREIYGTKEIPKPIWSWAEKLSQRPYSPGTESAGVPKEKIQNGVSQALISKRQQGLPIVCVTSDLSGSTGTQSFGKEFPKAFFDVGVAEANMVSVAAGLSKLGFIPVVDTFSQFGITKGSLPTIMSSLSKAPFIGIFSHTGFQDAADGASHQSISYLAMASAIPHVNCYCLTSSEEARSLVGQAIDHFVESYKQRRTPNTHLFFLGRENFPKRYLVEGFGYKLGSAQILSDNSTRFKQSILLAVTGSLVPQALEASELLSGQNVGTIVVNPSVINRPDLATITEGLARTNGMLLTVEDHHVIGGMGAQLIHALAQHRVAYQARSLGIHDFGQSAYQAQELYKKFELDAQAIFKAAMKVLKN